MSPERFVVTLPDILRSECEKEDGTCDDMQANLPWGSRKGSSDFTDYRYILDIDGNGWSARTQQLFASGAVVIKNSLFKEWWNDRIQPWKHYVPVTLDFSDIYEVLNYVSGCVTSEATPN